VGTADDTIEAAAVEAILRLEHVASLSKVVGALPIVRLLLWELWYPLTPTPARLGRVLGRCQLLAVLRLRTTLGVLPVTVNPVAGARALVTRARTLLVFQKDFVIAMKVVVAALPITMLPSRTSGQSSPVCGSVGVTIVC
jgi:hypothetical protein